MSIRSLYEWLLTLMNERDLLASQRVNSRPQGKIIDIECEKSQ